MMLDAEFVDETDQPPHLGVTVAPETVLQVYDKMLLLLGERNSRIGCKSPFRRFRFLLGGENPLTASCFYTQEFTSRGDSHASTHATSR